MRLENPPVGGAERPGFCSKHQPIKETQDRMHRTSDHERLPALLSHISAKLQRFAEERPEATETDMAKFIVDDVDRLSVHVFERAELAA